VLEQIWPDMSRRAHGDELLNRPQADEHRQRQTLEQFSLLNSLFSPARRLLTRLVIRDMQKSPKKTYRFLDIGTGGGDLPLWLAKQCARRGLAVQITAVDNAARVVRFAQNKCGAFPNITVRRADAFQLEAHTTYDYVFSSNLLHHLPETDLPRFLRLVSAHTGRLFVMKDLYRSRPAYLGFSLFAAVFLRSGFHFNDGRISIRRGFKLRDLEQVIRESRLTAKAQVKKGFPAAVYIHGRGGAALHRDR
jgi:2-polyprenyl-3-methyl-5-hydroxy-6-metoxy-1,4-benzoquinol methylase